MSFLETFGCWGANQFMKSFLTLRLQQLMLNISIDIHVPTKGTIWASFCNFNSINFIFCPRSSNGLTYNLVHWASFYNSWKPQPIKSIFTWALVNDVDG